jgi:molecular chaperone GrpE
MAAFADNGSTPEEGVEPATTSDAPVGDAGTGDAGTEDRATGETATDEISPELLDVEREVEHDIDALLGERDQFKAIALRLQADFENYRKRADRQVSDEVDRATGRLVEELLPVLDACEAAFAHGVDGIEPIWSQLLGVLQRQGLEVMDPSGKPFDPSEHEAVMHEPGDGGEAVVAEVFREGYRWKGKVLRAAMVKVKG